MTIKSIFDDDFTNDFFKRRRPQFPSLFDSSSIFEDAKLDFDRIVKLFREEVEEMNKRSGIEFKSRTAFNEDPFAFSKSLTNFMHNDRIFDSSRAIESSNGIGNGNGNGFGSGINNNSSNSNSFTNSILKSSNNNANLNRSLANFGDETSTSTPGKYTLNIPLGNRIQPEDLKISLKEENGLKIMSIEAKREEKSEDANRKSFVSQQFSRTFTLPQNCEINEVQSILTEGGNLKVEAPLREVQKPQIQQQQQHVTHTIPIDSQNQVAIKRYGPTTIPINIEK